MNSLFVQGNFTIPVESLDHAQFNGRQVSVSVLRLDTIHPVVSGNKIFKLHYFLDEAINSPHQQIITCGGTYSNHLVATAYICKEKKLRSVGMVRGERPAKLSHTLLSCIQNGMQVEFISRHDYQKINNKEFRDSLTKKYGDHTLVPEGGFSGTGASGAKLITNYFNSKNFTHICCPVGTATTFAGLIAGCGYETLTMGFSVLKNLNDINARLKELQVESGKKYLFNGDYHFGGYAKKTAELIDFMNIFFEDTKIPLDFVYTGKMMFGVYDLIRKKFFPSGSNILCVHTGGLQGNRSLAQGMLNF